MVEMVGHKSSFDSQECTRAEAKMCCFSSVITVCHQVICSRVVGKNLSVVL